MCLHLNNEGEHVSHNPPRLHHGRQRSLSVDSPKTTGTTIQLLHCLIIFSRRASIEKFEISSGKIKATKPYTPSLPNPIHRRASID
ncbi:hypothetical protein Bca101_064761 [Brassica carinata]